MIGSKSEQPDRFKTQTNDPSKLLGCNSNTLQDLVKQKKSLCIIVLLSKYFLNTFVKITILGELYQYSSCCTKLEQHWTKCLYVHSSPIVQHDGEQLFCLADPCWWLELRSSNFNVSSVWFLNLFGIKVLISSLPKIYKPQLGNFCKKLFQRRALICLQNKNFFIELLWAHTLIF